MYTIDMCNQNQQGISLIEILLVIVIVAIISVVAIPRWEVEGLGIEFEARRLANDIQYAKALSMASGQRYRWVKVSDSSYSIVNESGSAMVMPSGGTVISLTNNVQFSSLSNLPNSLLAFSSLGVPYIISGLPGTALSSTATINLSSGSESRSVNIVADTGYVSLS